MKGVVVSAKPVIAQRSRIGFVLHITRKVQQISFALKADQVIRKQGAHQPLILRNGRQNGLRRKGNVQEKANAVFAPQGTQFSGQRYQVVVMHPDEVIRLEQAHELACKQPVNAPVSFKKARIKTRKVQAVMKHRPKHAIAVAQVVAVVVFGAQINRGQRDPAGLVYMQLALAWRAIADDISAPAKPQPPSLIQSRSQGNSQAAGSCFSGVCNAIGHNNQATHNGDLIFGIPMEPTGVRPR